MADQSPYMMGGGAPSFGPPGGLGQLLAQPAQIAAQDRATGSRNIGQLASALEDYSQQQKQINAAGKAADYAVKANPTMLNDIGLTLDQWANLGSQDKASAVQGYTEQQGIKKGLAQLQDYYAQAKEREAESNASQNAGQFLSNYLQAPAQGGIPANSGSDGDGQGNDVPPTQMDPFSRMAYAAKQMPANWDVGRTMPKVMDSLTKMYAVAQANKTPEDNTPKWMKGPNGEWLVYQPGTRNPPAFSPFTKGESAINVINARSDANSEKGLLPEGTTFSTSSNGFGIATLPDGSIKNLGRVPAAKKNLSEFFAKFMGDTSEQPPIANNQVAKAITPEIAAQYLQKSGGDKDKARAAAKADGYTF